MTTRTYQTYEEATQDYLARFRALRDAPAAKSRQVTRGAADIPVDTLIARAEDIAEVSASMVPLARGYLEATDPTLREGISGQLLAQAAAEMQVATELMEIAAREAAGPAEESSQAPRGVTRAARGAKLRGAIDSMEKAMAMPVSAGLVDPCMIRSTRAAAGTPEEEKKSLQQTAILTAGAISQRVVEVGGDLAFDLVFKSEWSAVIQSAGLFSKDIANLLDHLKEGAGILIQHAISTATNTILNAYNKILALLGSDVENEALKRVRDWLEQIQQAGKIDLFEQMVGKLYHVDALEGVLPIWLDKTKADADTINDTTKDVAVLSDKFTVLVERINKVGDVIGLARFVQAQFPQVLGVVIAIRVSLLAVLVYAGYDYIGYEQIRYPNLTKGVAEIIKENLLLGA
jgi:hypothetical protein